MLFIHVMNISQVTNVYFVRQFRTLSANILYIFLFSVFLCQKVVNYIFNFLMHRSFINWLALALASIKSLS